MAGGERRKRTAVSEQQTSQTSLPPAPGVPQGFLRAVVALVVLSSAGWIVYGRALRYPFIFDDNYSIVTNSSITRLSPFFGAPGPLVGPVNSPTSGTPLVNLSLALNYHFGRLDPLGYHIFNLVLHSLAAMLLWAIIDRTLRLPFFGGRFDRGAWSIALVVALAWLAHPLQTESVEYTTQRTELMMGFFYLATIYASLRYFCAATWNQRAAWLVVAGLACLLGMTCKEVMVSAPLIVLLFDRTFLTGSFRQALRRSWPLYVLLALSWIMLLILNIGAPREESAGFNLGVPAHVWWFTQAKVLAMYLKLVFWPWPLSIHYHMPYLDAFTSAWPWVGVVALLGGATLALFWRGYAAGFLGACVFIILSPTLVIPVIKEVVAERRMYLPLAAILTLVIVGAYAILQSVARASEPESNSGKKDRWPLAITIVSFIALAVAMCLVSAKRLTAYREAVTLWQDAVLRDPDNDIASINLGMTLNDAGRSAEASEHMRQFLEQHPDSEVGHHVMAMILLNVNQPSEAIEHLQRALHGPDRTLVQFHLGMAFTAAGRPQEAIEHFKAVAKENPDGVDVQNRLAMALTLAGKPDLAIEHFQRAVSLAPDSAVIHGNLGMALKAAGRLPEARHELEKAVQLGPDEIDSRIQLAMLYADLGQSAAAVAMAEKALAMARISGNPQQTQFLESWLRQRRARD